VTFESGKALVRVLLAIVAGHRESLDPQGRMTRSYFRRPWFRALSRINKLVLCAGSSSNISVILSTFNEQAWQQGRFGRSNRTALLRQVYTCMSSFNLNFLSP
jgi:hypothetical protein